MQVVYPLVGEEVDDGVIHWTGLRKVHGHGGEQGRNIQLRVHNYHHGQRRVGQPADKKCSNHGQDHADGVIIVTLPGTPTLQLKAPVQLVESKFELY